MAYCSQTLTGISLDCESSQGGVRKIYVANFGDVASETETDGKLTAFTMKESTKFVRYDLRKNTAHMDSPMSVGDNGSRFWSNSVYVDLGKMTTAKRLEMEALTAGQLYVIVEDTNGTLWALTTTKDDYVAASAGNGGTGTARTDANRYDLTLTAEATHLPIEVAREALADIVAD
jgi:hypothetical protein